MSNPFDDFEIESTSTYRGKYNDSLLSGSIFSTTTSSDTPSTNGRISKANKSIRTSDFSITYYDLPSPESQYSLVRFRPNYFAGQVTSVRHSSDSETWLDTVVPNPKEIYTINGGKIVTPWEASSLLFTANKFTECFQMNKLVLGIPNGNQHLTTGKQYGMYTDNRDYPNPNNIGAPTVSTGSSVSDNKWICSYPFQDAYKTASRLIDPINPEFPLRIASLPTHIEYTFPITGSDTTTIWAGTGCYDPSIITTGVPLLGSSGFGYAPKLSSKIFLTLQFFDGTTTNSEAGYVDPVTRNKWLGLIDFTANLTSTHGNGLLTGSYNPRRWASGWNGQLAPTTHTWDSMYMPKARVFLSAFYGFGDGPNHMPKFDYSPGVHLPSAITPLRGIGSGSTPYNAFTLPGDYAVLNTYTDFMTVGDDGTTPVLGTVRESRDYTQAPVAIIRGLKYGLMGIYPTASSCVFRVGRYGQVRDMLEQRRDGKFYDKIGYDLNGFQTGNKKTLEGPVQIRYKPGTTLPAIGETPEGTVYTGDGTEIPTASRRLYYGHKEAASGKPFRDRGSKEIA